MSKQWLPVALAVGSLAFASSLIAEELKLAEGKVTLSAPESWKQKEPANKLITYEFEAPAADDDTKPGRATVSSASGSVEQNIDRWLLQFELKGNKPKKEETKVAGQKVYLVDIAGTFKEPPPGAGPFSGAKPILREDYRMLGAIIATDKNGQHFVKLTGPKATIEKNEEAFKKMIDSLKVK
jgi:hypothetical protein